MVISMERWVGKVAVVTGASAGIGAAIAESLVKHGLLVVGMARRVEKVEELAQKLSNEEGKLYPLKVDVTVEQEILDGFQWITENLGPVHILINNAGILQPTYLIGGDTEKWKKVLDTNILGVCIATREAIEIMKKNEIDGHIIHVNSVAGHMVPNNPGANVYPASKHAVTALAETLRYELLRENSKIKITSLSPGVVATEIFENSIGVMKDLSVDSTPALESEDVADATIYALSTPPHVQVKELIIKPINEQF